MSILPISDRSSNGVCLADSADADKLGGTAEGEAVVDDHIPGITPFRGRTVWNGVKGRFAGAFLARQLDMIRLMTFHIGVASRPLVSIVFFKTSTARARSKL
jgi:hypothetical protein